MKFEALLESLGAEAWFDFPTVALLFPEGDAAIRTDLYRFRKARKLLELKRGLYAFATPYQKAPLTGPAVAGALYRPSYLSERWALSWYGAIPEMTVLHTSVSTRSTRSFENPFGRYRYRTLAPRLFFGFRSAELAGCRVDIAEPEKALLDLWYLEKATRDIDGMASLRLEAGAFDLARLEGFAEGFHEPSIDRAVEAFRGYAAEASEGSMRL